MCKRWVSRLGPGSNLSYAEPNTMFTLSPPQRLLLYCAEIGDIKARGRRREGGEEKGSSRLFILPITPRAPLFSVIFDLGASAVEFESF